MHQDDGLPPEILCVATEWHVRLSECDERGRREFIAWLAQDSRHVRGMLELAGLERGINGLPPEVWHRLKKVLRGKPFAETAPKSPSLWDRLTARFEEALFSRLAAVITSFLAFVFAIQVASHDLAPVFQTQVGERRLVQLRDGSLMHLNTNSHVRIEFSSRRRTVHILRGEALFAVAHDPGRPFDVRMGDISVRAVGTEFNVHRDQETTVSVFAGRVQILESRRGFLWLLSPSGLHAEISEGEEARLRASSVGLQVDVTPISSMTLSQRRAWTRGLILINGEPLRYVIEQFNRYHQTQIVLDEPSFDGPRLGGVFQVGDLDRFLQLITSLHGLDVTESGLPPARVIHLKRRAAEQERTLEDSAESGAASAVH